MKGGKGERVIEHLGFEQAVPSVRPYLSTPSLAWTDPDHRREKKERERPTIPKYKGFVQDSPLGCIQGPNSLVKSK